MQKVNPKEDMLTVEAVGFKTMEEIAIPPKKISRGMFDLDPMRTIVRKDIEKMFEYQKETLLWAYFMCNSVTDKMDLRAKGKLKSEWEGTSDKKSVKERPSYFPDLKMSDYPKLITGARTFLKKEGYDLSLIKDLRQIRFLIEFETTEDSPGFVTAQLCYVNDTGQKHKTEFIRGYF